MTPAPQPRMHGLTHVPGGPDPIPGMPTAPTGSLAGVILATPDLEGFWKLNETSGDIAADSFDGWDMDSGAASPPTWAQPAGPPGETAAAFGTGLGETNTLFGALTGDLTLEIWGNRDDDVHSQMMIGQGNAITPNGPGVALLMAADTLGGLTERYRLNAWIGDTTGGPHVLPGDNPLVVGDWYHCAVTRLAGVWTLYVNGVAQTATYDDTGTNYSAAPGIWIGLIPATTAACEGTLSYGAAYSRALTAAEIGIRYTAATVGGVGLVWTSGDDGTASWQPVQVDGVTLEVGVADSGGTGYRMVRVPN